MTIRVGIVGASGYTGVELARILTRHPEVRLTVATSRRYAGQPLDLVFPSLRRQQELLLEDLDIAELPDRADLFFLAVPHKAAMALAPALLEAGKRVIDLSADFRILDQEVYEAWYAPHTAPELLQEAVYGLPELHRDRIRSARLVANPGCYPTSVLLALAPLLRAGLLASDSLVVDAKSGTSGAGRAPGTATLFCEVHDSFKAYKVGGVHRHIPEMEQELGRLAGERVRLTFTPHLLPISRGILSTIYARPARETSRDELERVLRQAYDGEPFVRVCRPEEVVATQHVRGANYCDIQPHFDERTGRVILLAAIDNIVKGASGQAVQNMNLMLGFEETTGLTQLPLLP